MGNFAGLANRFGEDAPSPGVPAQVYNDGSPCSLRSHLSGNLWTPTSIRCERLFSIASPEKPAQNLESWITKSGNRENG